MNTEIMNFDEMAAVEGGSGFTCGLGVGLSVIAGVTAAVATGGWALVAGFAYFGTIVETLEDCSELLYE